ncbi:DUF1189 family protein [Psychrobacillus sp. NPDC096623]|uniref:DUF1189 family protein n=1 Tax=Psychrobacillus sp. NPDC096623 TaxID=3364492 RepID=UPI0037FECBAD
MSLFQLFKSSFTSPKKIAAFRLIPIGKVMQYIFSYIFIMSIISFVFFINGISDQQQTMEGLLEYFAQIQWLLYPFSFLFLFVLNTLFIFVRISILAYIGSIILRIRNRKGEFRHIWRTALFASTIPLLLSIIFAILQFSNNYIQLLIYILSLVIITFATKYYPVKR